MKKAHMGSGNHYQLLATIGCLYAALLLYLKPNRGIRIDNGRKELKEKHTKEGSRAKYNFEYVLGSK